MATHPAIQAYNDARDREQHAFEVSPLGQAFMAALNRYGGPGWVDELEAVGLSLALEATIGASMPAFYAGRALRLW